MACVRIPYWNIVLYNTTEVILGHACRVYELEGKYFRTRYYVSKELRIAPATYRKHLAYNWSAYGEHTDGALILGLEHEFKQFRMKGVAVSIDEFSMGDKALEISEQLIREHCL